MPSADRYCRSCGHLLRGLEVPRCPECGGRFDPSNSQTTSSSPRPWRRTLAVLAKVLIGLGVGVATIVVVVNAKWPDPLIAALIGVVGAPVVLLGLLLGLIPTLPVSRRWRIAALVIPIAIVTTVWKSWPYRIVFEFHRGAFDAEVSAIRASAASSEDWTFANSHRAGPDRVGMFTILDIQETPQGNLGFQLTGDGGGGVHLVRVSTNSTFLWWNTNWETNLGGGWWVVYQD